MIAYLKGKIIHKDTDSVIIETGGVGYQVFASSNLIQLLNKGQQCEIFIHHHVREDQQTLYGFKDLQERELFRKLLSVSGIGPKSALAAVGAASLDEIVSAVQAQDHSLFMSVPGIGEKIAQRLVLELKNKLKIFPIADIGNTTSGQSNIRVDVIEALEQLGYSPQITHQYLQQTDVSQMTLEQAIKEVLKRISTK